MAKFQPAFSVMKSMSFENIGTAYLSGFMSERSKMNRNLRNLALQSGSMGPQGRASITRQNNLLDAYQKNERALRREQADINKMRRQIKSQEGTRKERAMAHAARLYAIQEQGDRRLESQREREIRKAESGHKSRLKNIRKAKDANKHIDKIGGEIASRIPGMKGIESVQSFKSIYRSTDKDNKAKMEQAANEVLATALFGGLNPTDPIFEGSNITEGQFIDGYIKNVLIGDNVDYTANQSKKLEKQNDGIRAQERKAAQKKPNRPMTGEEAREAFRQEYLKGVESVGEEAFLNKQEEDINTRLAENTLLKNNLMTKLQGSIDNTSRANIYDDVQLSSEFDLPASMMDELFFVPGEREVSMSDPSLLDGDDVDPLNPGMLRYEMGGGQISDTVRGQRPERMRGVEFGDVVEGPTTQDFTATAAAAPSVRREARLGRERDPVEESMVPRGDMLPMRDPTIRKSVFEPELEIPADQNRGRLQQYFNQQDEREVPQPQMEFDPKPDPPSAAITDPAILDEPQPIEEDFMAVDFDERARRGKTALEKSVERRQSQERARDEKDERAVRAMTKQTQRLYKQINLGQPNENNIALAIRRYADQLDTTPKRLSKKQQEIAISQAFNNAVQDGIGFRDSSSITNTELRLMDDPVALRNHYMKVLAKRR